MPSEHAPATDLRFIFQHGWGFHASCWREWRVLLARPCLVGDRGYWGDPVPLERSATSSGSVLVCHSLGLHFLPAELLAHASLLVIISGFAQFHGQNSADGRFSRKHVQKMLSRLRTDPTALIADFYRDCGCAGWPVDPRPMDTALLARDLLLLDQGRVEERRFAKLPAILLLHGREDRVARPERAAELAGLLCRSQVTIIDGAGHGLPFTHPQLCLELICDFYKKTALPA